MANEVLTKLPWKRRRSVLIPVADASRERIASYCSTYCEGAAETADITCLCGHPPCSDQMKT